MTTRNEGRAPATDSDATAAAEREVKGSVQEAIGKLIGDDAARARGAAEKKAGAAEKASADEKAGPGDASDIKESSRR